MSKRLEITPAGGDGEKVNSFTVQAVLRGLRRLLHENKNIRRAAEARLVQAGAPNALKIFMNNRDLPDTISPDTLSEFVRVTGLPDKVTFIIGDHKADTGQWEQ